MKKILRLYPELVAIPTALVGYTLAVFFMRYVDETEPIIDLHRWLAFPFAILSAFFANFTAYAAIKYNRPDLWKAYSKVFTDCWAVSKMGMQFEQSFNTLWWRYYVSILASLFLSLYLVA